jgi:hypothetical protein
MRAYRERLVVPAWWWITGTVCVLLLGTTVWAGFSPLIGLAVYAILEGACAAVLLSWGSVVIEVRDGYLQVGSRGLALAGAGEVAAMDAAQTRALRGPRADPSAYLLVRPYLPQSVYVATPGRPDGKPYWLIGTRHPEELAQAIERARTQTGGEAACDDAHGDHALEAGSTGRAEA